jgi:hypothetical protein
LIISILSQFIVDLSSFIGPCGNAIKKREA